MFLQGAALPVADDGDRLAVEEGHAPQDAAVVGTQAVAPLLKEIGEEGGDEVGGGPAGPDGEPEPPAGRG